MPGMGSSAPLRGRGDPSPHLRTHLATHHRRARCPRLSAFSSNAQHERACCASLERAARLGQQQDHHRMQALRSPSHSAGVASVSGRQPVVLRRPALLLPLPQRQQLAGCCSAAAEDPYQARALVAPARATCFRGGGSSSKRLRACSASLPLEQVLGIKEDADNTEITRAYNRARSKHRGNSSMIQKIETAHGQLMMKAFNARLKVRLAAGRPLLGGSSLARRRGAGRMDPRCVRLARLCAQSGNTIPKEIKYADREQLFPWRPK